MMLTLAQAQALLPGSTLVGDGAGSIFKLFTVAAALDMGMGIDFNGTQISTTTMSVPL